MFSILKKNMKKILFFVVLLILVALIEYIGLWGIIIFIVAIAAWRIYTKWDDLIRGMELIEGRIWGKPLSKDYWDKEELKNTKVKLTWRKKKT